jgi:hypothetical protein
MASYDDPAISGASMILRPGVQALVQDAQRGKFDVVLAEALDRMSRNQAAASTLLALISVTTGTFAGCARYERPCGRNSYAFNEIASSHWLPQGLGPRQLHR